MKNLVLLLCLLVSTLSFANDKCAYTSQEAAQKKLNELSDEYNITRSNVEYIKESENYILFSGSVSWAIYDIVVEMNDECDVVNVSYSEMH